MKFYLEKWNFKNCIHFAKINKEILQIIAMLFVGVNLTKVTCFFVVVVLIFCTSLWNLLKFSQWYPLSRGVDLTTYLSFFLSRSSNNSQTTYIYLIIWRFHFVFISTLLAVFPHLLKLLNSMESQTNIHSSINEDKINIVNSFDA